MMMMIMIVVVIIIIIIIIITITTKGRVPFEMLINYNFVKKFLTF
jgi:hypothetical protein